VGVDLSGLGVAVGHATDDAGATGLTVVRGIDEPLRGGVAVFGRATGSRELHTLEPGHVTRGRVDAVMLTGGSAYGLDAASGAMRWLEERGRGFPVGQGVVPIVPAAVVFDLAPIGRFDARPTPAMAYDAMERASPRAIAEGSVGAGTGTTVGKIAGARNAMKGGFGCALARGGDVLVAALVVVNAAGDVRDASGRIIAGARAREGGFVDSARLLTHGATLDRAVAFDALAILNTTLAVVVSSAPLDGLALTQLARAAGAGLYRRVTPAGSAYDGDIVFALCREPATGSTNPAADAMTIEALAVCALEDAIERAVRLARGRDGIPGLADESHAA
jgi:L-aminopeptidase/D-esterase-like protein